MESYEEGRLHRSSTAERWEIVFGVDDSTCLHSGHGFEVLIGGKWIYTSIEHNGEDYYASTAGIKLVRGLPARFP